MVDAITYRPPGAMYGLGPPEAAAGDHFMGILPRKAVDLIEFCQQHSPIWMANAASIGIKETEMPQLDGSLMAAQDARSEMLTARDALRVATDQYHTAITILDKVAAGFVANITGFAKNSDSPPHVYALASLPLPATRTPVPAPGTPTTPSVSLEQSGALTLGWKCKNPRNSAGTMYEVHRQVNGGAWEPVATTGKKSHTDTGIPAGAMNVNYQVRAVRSTLAGAPAQFNVRLGTGSAGAGGAAVAAVAPEALGTMRRAA
jgi:hypothetical protein